MQARLQDVLFQLEERFWMEGPAFYERNLADEAVMVFPEPAGVLSRDEIVAALGGPRWVETILEEHRLLELSEGAALVAYKATARRQDGQRYQAHGSSVYVRDRAGAWRLAFHQQTPLA